MSKELPFVAGDTIPVRAMYVGERLELRAFAATSKYALLPLTIAAGARGVAVLYRYGVVVLYHLTPIEEAALLNDLDGLIWQKFERPEVEEVVIEASEEAEERGHDGLVTVRAFDVERLQTLADVLAKSVVLAHYEETIAEVFDAIEPLAEDLTSAGSSRRSSKELLRHIGGTLVIQTKTVWRVEINDKPEILWDRPALEILYARLVDEYELEERHLALERKLLLISRTATTALELLHNKRSLRVEWYIVILIVVEIVITLYELFLH